MRRGTGAASSAAVDAFGADTFELWPCQIGTDRILALRT
jgi:hypothetical protein